MNIIIPLGGKGERFIGKFNLPKPLIKILEKCMIEYVLDNLYPNKDDKFFIIYNYNLDKFNIRDIILNKYPFITMIKIDDTKGASETLLKGLEYIIEKCEYNKKCLVIDCDTFYTDNIIDIFRDSKNNTIFYTNNYSNNVIYSYIIMNSEQNIISIKEKVKISDNANTGAYAFIDINELLSYCKYIVNNDICFNNEPYISCVINRMLEQNIIFKGKKLNTTNVFSLGTPEDVENFINNRLAFLFDLDGTLVITDSIYFKVWSIILKKYNIILDDDIFKNIIMGNNDKFVIESLLNNLKINIEEISILKDTLFISHIDDIKIVDGVVEILYKIKKSGFKSCIVTNCNRLVANEIIKKINISNLIDFCISINDCEFGKPNPEPYLKAIQKYNIINTNVFIFEDSKTGILSGKSVNPRLLIGLETNYSPDELKNYGVDISIKNFLNLDINNLFKNENNSIKYLTKLISNCTNYNIEDININNIKLKGGFIADVIGFDIKTIDTKQYFILKYENKELNNLSIMAKKLDLYNREYYFYSVISQHIDIKMPKFLCLLKDDKHKNIGLILENLFIKDYKVNLNLSIENIDISLKIVDRMARIHSKFWNKDLTLVFPELKKCNNSIFYPFFNNFIMEKGNNFIEKWSGNLNEYQNKKCLDIITDFQKIQIRLSENNLTFIHGDIKSPNIFYDIKNNYEPYFIDWQHCANGKGVQDLIFFIIESYDITNIKLSYNLFKYYYYKKILEYNIKNYTFKQYEEDIKDAICYIPFFTAIWFGTTPNDELIDKNWPFFFITKLFYLIEYIFKE